MFCYRYRFIPITYDLINNNEWVSVLELKVEYLWLIMNKGILYKYIIYKQLIYLLVTYIINNCSLYNSDSNVHVNLIVICYHCIFSANYNTVVIIST